MIDHLVIKNFKSIREVVLQPKRVNLFIGEPNTGKTNLIEALALFSEGILIQETNNTAIQEVLRIQSISDLFWNCNVQHPFLVETEAISAEGTFQEKEQSLQIKYEFGTGNVSVAKLNVDAQLQGPAGGIPEEKLTRYYRFDGQIRESKRIASYLLPPHGSNLVSLLRSNPDILHRIQAMFRVQGYYLEIHPVKAELSVSKKESEDLYFRLPFESISQTFQRMVFYKAALESNQNSVLLLDEPDASTFPMYTKELAERIGLDESNQFFITTHNPYALGSIVEKTNRDELAVNIVTLRNFATEVYPLSQDQLSEVLDLNLDLFLNLDRFLER